MLSDNYDDIYHKVGDFGTDENGNPVTWVVQKYIENPMIVFKRKFDIRIWVVVASWNPLQIYWYRKPYVRFSAHDYDPNDFDNLYSHLTNASISKKEKE